MRLVYTFLVPNLTILLTATEFRFVSSATKSDVEGEVTAE
jgi:hypothetical protein